MTSLGAATWSRVAVALSLASVQVAASLAADIGVTIPTSRAEMDSTVAKLWINRDFGQLESLDRRFRDQSQVSRSGYWLGDLFIQAIYVQLKSEASSEPIWKAASTVVDQWIEQFPTSALPRVVRADLFTTRAWAVRGSGFASELSPAQRSFFSEYLNHAKSLLAANKEIAGNHLAWHQAMAEIMQWSGAEETEFLALMNEAIARFPTSARLFAIAISRSSRQWGGGQGDIGRTVSTLIGKVPKHLQEEMYARAFGQAAQQYPEEVMPGFDCAKLMRGFKQVVKDHPTPYNIHQGARASFECRDREMARTLFSVAVPPIPPGTWGVGQEAGDRYERWLKWKDAPEKELK